MDCYDFERAAARLRQRPITELADFIASLLIEPTTGIGAYARAFAAPDCATTARVVEHSIDCWSHVYKHETYHQAAAAAQQLDWTLGAIERCLLPHDPSAAFRLIVRFFEADDDLRQDDLDAISNTFRRAASLFRAASTAVPPDRVQAELKPLLANDYSGYRAWLAPEATEPLREN
jgi:hypothetical protein